MIDVLIERLKQAQSETMAGLVATPPTTLEAVYEKIGRIRGIESAIEEILNLVRDADEADR